MSLSHQTSTNNNKRIFALLSLGLLLAAVLLPILIAAFSPLEIAFTFGLVAGLLAILFGALGWSDRIGRTVAVAALFILVVGGGSYAILYQKWRAESRSATVEPTPPTPAGQR